MERYMTIKVGDRVPDGTLTEFFDTEADGCALGPNAFQVADLDGRGAEARHVGRRAGRARHHAGAPAARRPARGRDGRARAGEAGGAPGLAASHWGGSSCVV